jgi:hypothetical protein
LRALRLIAGAVAGFLVWWYGTLVYDGGLSFAAERVLRLESRICAAQLTAVERHVEVTPHLCVAPKAIIPADQLTYNLILFVALFAYRFRSVQSFFASLFVLVVSHILSLALSIEATYAGRLGTWSDQHFSGMQQDVWTAIDFWWRLGGMFAIVFVLWWLTLSPVFQPSRDKGERRRKRVR